MKKADRIYYGGDYNPDQWDDQTIDEDMRLFKKAGINLLTLPVFHGQSLSQTRVFIISNGWTESLIKFGKTVFMYALLLQLLHNRPGCPPDIQKYFLLILQEEKEPMECACSSA